MSDYMFILESHLDAASQSRAVEEIEACRQLQKPR